MSDNLTGTPTVKNSNIFAAKFVLFFFQVVSPMCLLYLSSKRTLLPVAIQLFAKPGPENPVSEIPKHAAGRALISDCFRICNGDP